MAQIKFEQVPANEHERRLQEHLSVLVGNATVADCRNLRGIVDEVCGVLNCNMVIGCGGSHIYIHRASEFVAGEHTNANNIRWAIITD